MADLKEQLSEEESEIAAAYERGEYSAVGDLDGRKQFWKDVLKETTKKRPVNLRLQEQDIRKVKAMAYEQGIPYQTLISSIIHRYVKGDLRAV